MTKKNLRPQQVAPVQRETNATSSVGEKGASAAAQQRDCEELQEKLNTFIYQVYGKEGVEYYCKHQRGAERWTPFAGDDAE